MKTKAKPDKILESAMETPENKDILSGLISDSPTPDEAKAKMVDSLMDDRNILKTTELSDYELAHVAILKAINSKVDSKIMNEFVTSFLKAKVSKSRLGRKEVIEIAKNEEHQDESKKPFWKFWG